MVLFAIIYRRSPFSFRKINAFTRLQHAARLVVEDGTRLHFALGNGNILTPEGASALAGLILMRRLGEISSLSDLPSIATTGNGVLNLLAQDTLRAAHDSVGVEQTFDMNNVRLTGFTPMSYAAGIMPAIRAENISSNVMIGNFGPEVGLVAEAAERQNASMIGASDSLTAQAVLFATSAEMLVGEELFAAGAYAKSSPFHAASLLLQDILRWLIILGLLAGAVLKLAGVL
jgi:hypothetical protein